MKILIVDDSREDRELIVTYIQRSTKSKKISTSVDQSNCLQDALDKIKVHNYDVIILDLALPESDGVQTIKAIQDALSKEEKVVPIIILTGLEDYTIGKEAFALGVKEYLIKDEIGTGDVARAIKYATFNKKTSKKTTV